MRDLWADPKQMESQNELYIEEKKELRQYWFSLDSKKSWWAEAMWRYCYLRNVQDPLADAQTPYVGSIHHVKGRLIHLEHKSNSFQVHQKTKGASFRQKIPPGKFIGYALHAERYWTNDLLMMDTQDPKTIPPRRETKN